MQGEALQVKFTADAEKQNVNLKLDTQKDVGVEEDSLHHQLVGGPILTDIASAESNIRTNDPDDLEVEYGTAEEEEERVNSTTKFVSPSQYRKTVHDLVAPIFYPPPSNIRATHPSDKDFSTSSQRRSSLCFICGQVGHW